MNIKPLGERVLLKRIEEKDQIEGGIIIPDLARKKSQIAEVIAIGTYKQDQNGNQVDFLLKPGDRVLVPSYGGTPVKIDNDEFILIDEDSLLGLIAADGEPSDEIEWGHCSNWLNRNKNK